MCIIPEEARKMTEADVLVPHVGLTTKGLIGAKTALDLNESARLDGFRLWPTPRSRSETT